MEFVYLILRLLLFLSIYHKNFLNFRFENELISVKSSWIKHRVASFGFVIEQKPLAGKYIWFIIKYKKFKFKISIRLDVDALKALKIPPGPIYSKIKAGQNVTLPDGQIVNN